jgi:hypothetical protein
LQFREVHTIHIDAPPARVFAASKRVRPDEIFLFRTLIAIRAFGPPPPRIIQDATKAYESLHDIATHSTLRRRSSGSRSHAAARPAATRDQSP